MKYSDTDSLETDVVIIGAGGGGLPAAVAAAEEGMKVIVVEKRATAGGNASIAGGIFGAESKMQKRLKIDARKSRLFKEGMEYAHWKIDPEILRVLINRSGETIDWCEKQGVVFVDVPHFYFNQVPRVMHLPEKVGSGLVKAMIRRCGELGVTIFYNTPAKRLLKDESGAISGVVAEHKGGEITIAAKSVIISSGGYGGNRDLLKKWVPCYTEDLYSVGLPFTGDGILMALQLGALTEGLGNVLLRGPYFPYSLQVTTAVQEPTMLWVNKLGKRFADEALSFRWPHSANALNRQPGRICYMLFDEELKRDLMENGIIKGYSRYRGGARLTQLDKNLKTEVERGWAVAFDSWGDIARWIGSDPAVLAKTVDEYNVCCDRENDAAFGKDRSFLVSLRTPPYYAVKCVQAFLCTAGGLKINCHMEVIGQDDRPIPGLYAAGSDTGGWSSDTYCLPLAGTAFGFAVNSGRIAGENASVYTSARK